MGRQYDWNIAEAGEKDMFDTGVPLLKASRVTSGKSMQSTDVLQVTLEDLAVLREEITRFLEQKTRAVIRELITAAEALREAMYNSDSEASWREETDRWNAARTAAEELMK
jgi:hypothetical protein